MHIIFILNENKESRKRQRGEGRETNTLSIEEQRYELHPTSPQIMEARREYSTIFKVLRGKATNLQFCTLKN